MATTVIPVIDLLRGQAVRAIRGNRATYQPIVSALCSGSEPLAVARALCGRCQSSVLYVADLDALQGGEIQVAALRALLTDMPALELWVDAGFADVEAAATLAGQLGALATRVVPVFCLLYTSPSPRD